VAQNNLYLVVEAYKLNNVTALVENGTGKLPSRDQRIVYSFKQCFRSSPFLSLALDPRL